MIERTPRASPSQLLAVEYSPEVMREIRAYVTDGFERLSPGGLETGGVLFGARVGRRLRVLAMRRVACSYVQGTAFELSLGDRSEFERTILLHRVDSSLAGMQPVGWFLSHTKDSLVLRPSDQEIFDRYFPENWQVTLVIRPGRIGTLRAGTISRSDSADNGAVLNEFTIKQAGNSLLSSSSTSASTSLESRATGTKTALRSTPAGVPMSRERGTEGTTLLPAAAALVRQAPMAVAVRPAPQPRKSTPWLAIAACAAVLALAAGGAAAYAHFHTAEAVDLEAFPRDGVLWIKWNPAARPVLRATSGKMEITDGDVTAVRTLGEADLKRGLWPALCKQVDCTAKLSLYDGAVHIKQDMVRFAGRPPDPKLVPPPPAEDPERLAVRQLEDEKARLRDELDRERARSKGLQSHVKVLEDLIRTRDRH